MKRTIIFPIFATLLALPAGAQNVVDATRFGSTDIVGTARYRSMAGAFGALGGDLSSMTDNPAGMGIYRGTSAFALTPNLSFAHTKTQGDAIDKQKKSDCSMSNLGYVISFKTPSAEHLVNFNIGLGLNHSAGMKRRYRTVLDNSNTSFGSYLANRANNSLLLTGNYNKPGYMTVNGWNDNNFPLTAILGYDCYAIDDAGYFDEHNKFVPTGGVEATDKMEGWLPYQRMRVEESNRTDEYNINASFNFEDFLYAGVTLSIADFNSTINTEFNEDYQYDYNGSYTQYFNDLETKGSGCNVKLGLLIKPMPQWRLGFAVHTPTWLHMTDYYSGRMITDDNRLTDYSGGEVYEYKYRYYSPWEYQVSSAWVLGQKGLLSVEYDMKDFTTMKYKNDRDSWDGDGNEDINSCIKDFVQPQHTFKVGGEYRVTDVFSIRAGYAHKTSPYKDEVFNSNITRGWNNGYFGDDNTLLFDSSTKPNYALLDKQDYITAGCGWSFDSGWFIDFSFMDHILHEKVAAYPTTDALLSTDDRGVVTMTNDPHYGAVKGDHIDMKTFTLNWDLTIGMRF